MRQFAGPMFKRWPEPEQRALTARQGPRISGYYGLRGRLMVWGVPGAVWKAYWSLQPLRCAFGWHNWYSVLAGEASGCECGAFGPYPHHLMEAYRFRPWLRSWASRLREAEHRAAYWQADAYEARGYPEEAIRDVWRGYSRRPA